MKKIIESENLNLNETDVKNGSSKDDEDLISGIYLYAYSYTYVCMNIYIFT
jgi:hypothetical protein